MCEGWEYDHCRYLLHKIKPSLTLFTILLVDFFLIVFTLTHMCIHCVGNLLPSSCPPSTSRQNLFCLLFSNFVEEKTYEIIRKTVFLLVGTKNCLTERCLVLLPCTCVLQPTLVRLYQTSSLLPSVLCQFKITIFTHLQ
jgi:hypothetical protein